jgi:hypothetical protein
MGVCTAIRSVKWMTLRFTALAAAKNSTLREVDHNVVLALRPPFNGQVIIKGPQAGNTFWGHSILLDDQSTISY